MSEFYLKNSVGLPTWFLQAKSNLNLSFLALHFTDIVFVPFVWAHISCCRHYVRICNEPTHQIVFVIAPPVLLGNADRLLSTCTGYRGTCCVLGRLCSKGVTRITILGNACVNVVAIVFFAGILSSVVLFPVSPPITTKWSGKSGRRRTTPSIIWALKEMAREERVFLCVLLPKRPKRRKLGSRKKAAHLITSKLSRNTCWKLSFTSNWTNLQLISTTEQFGALTRTTAVYLYTAISHRITPMQWRIKACANFSIW